MDHCVHEMIGCEWCHPHVEDGTAIEARMRREFAKLTAAHELALRPQVPARVVPVPSTSTLPPDRGSRWLPRNPYPQHTVVDARVVVAPVPRQPRVHTIKDFGSHGKNTRSRRPG